MGRTPQICHSCKFAMELQSSDADTDKYLCPFCGRDRTIEKQVQRDFRPKCGLCDRIAVPQGDQYVCPNCRAIIDDRGDGITTASYNPERRLEREENRKQRHPAHHRGGSFQRWRRK